MTEENDEDKYCEEHPKTRLDKDGRCEDCDFAYIVEKKICGMLRAR
jgi:hypothetical protein